jgi:hypothetical protein
MALSGPFNVSITVRPSGGTQHASMTSRLTRSDPNAATTPGAVMPAIE